MILELRVLHDDAKVRMLTTVWPARSFGPSDLARAGKLLLSSDSTIISVRSNYLSKIFDSKQWTWQRSDLTSDQERLVDLLEEEEVTW